VYVSSCRREKGFWWKTYVSERVRAGVIALLVEDVRVQALPQQIYRLRGELSNVLAGSRSTTGSNTSSILLRSSSSSLTPAAATLS
jgi:hypothetical protein